jgi:hypothetical protein
VETRKQEIQDQFKEKLGLLVDIPKANFGNTNDGNTSRRFFENYEVSADIIKIDKGLIYRLRTILDTMCCGYKINVESFQKYSDGYTIGYIWYILLYGFYPMSPILHKVLRHGAEVIQHAILPIGQLSEEVAEARNKHIRQYRLNYSRKFSRVECNMDVLNRLLLTSDPLLTSLRTNIYFKKNRKPLYRDVLNLLSESDLLNENV